MTRKVIAVLTGLSLCLLGAEASFAVTPAGPLSPVPASTKRLS